MKVLLAGLLLLVGCDNDVERFPVVPGGGGGTGGVGEGMFDAAVTDGDAGDTITGKVCLVRDATAPTSCTTTNLENLTVTLGTFTATTAIDGSFTIMRPSGSNLVWVVSGANIVDTATGFGTMTQIPALSADVYDEMITANQAVQPDGTGAIIAKVLRNTTPVADLTATSNPVPQGGVYFYDGNSATSWTRDATNVRGAIWVPGVAPGSAQLTLMEGATTTAISSINVLADTVTFVFSTIP